MVPAAGRDALARASRLVVTAVVERVLGFQLIQALTKEFRKVGTAGRPIFAWDPATEKVYRFVQVTTEEHEDAKPGSAERHTTWVEIEEVE